MTSTPVFVYSFKLTIKTKYKLDQAYSRFRDQIKT